MKRLKKEFKRTMIKKEKQMAIQNLITEAHAESVQEFRELFKPKGRSFTKADFEVMGRMVALNVMDKMAQ